VAKSKEVVKRVQTGYVLRRDVVRRLRVHSATIGKPVREIIEGMVVRYLPKYDPPGKRVPVE
jgi:hypothetical protein